MEILLKSLSAAVVTAIILVIARFSGPKLAGAIGGIPIVFAISYVLVTLENKSTAKDFLIGGIYGAIAGIFFSVVLILFNDKAPPHYHWLNFAIAYLLCLFFVLGMMHFTNR